MTHRPACTQGTHGLYCLFIRTTLYIRSLHSNLGTPGIRAVQLLLTAGKDVGSECFPEGVTAQNYANRVRCAARGFCGLGALSASVARLSASAFAFSRAATRAYDSSIAALASAAADAVVAAPLTGAVALRASASPTPAGAAPAVLWAVPLRALRFNNVLLRSSSFARKCWFLASCRRTRLGRC